MKYSYYPIKIIYNYSCDSTFSFCYYRVYKMLNKWPKTFDIYHSPVDRD